MHRVGLSRAIRIRVLEALAQADASPDGIPPVGRRVHMMAAVHHNVVASRCARAESASQALRVAWPIPVPSPTAPAPPDQPMIELNEPFLHQSAAPAQVRPELALPSLGELLDPVCVAAETVRG